MPLMLAPLACQPRHPLARRHRESEPSGNPNSGENMDNDELEAFAKLLIAAGVLAVLLTGLLIGGLL